MRLTVDVPEELFEHLADLVAQRVGDPGQLSASSELLDPAAFASRLGCSREWVYDHKIELGGVKLGSRLVFEWPAGWERYAKTHRCGSEQSREPGPADGGRRTTARMAVSAVTNATPATRDVSPNVSRPPDPGVVRPSGTSVPLLPVGGSG